MYQILKSVQHLQNECILTYSKDKLIIYTKEIFMHMQTFRNFMSDIVAVATSLKGVIVVFCERELIAYKQTLTGWESSYSKNYNNPIKDAFFSHDDNYIVGCSQKKLHIWKSTYHKNTLLDQVEQFELIDLNEIYNIEMDTQIENVKFSPDSRYFTTLLKNTIIVWDFNEIREISQEGDLSQKQQVQLQHQDYVISYKFRGTLRIAPSPFPTPNTIVTLTTSNQLTIWQEMIQCNNFCKLHTLQFENVSSFCFIYLKGLTPYPWNNIFLETDAYGVQDTEQPSVDYLLVHQEKEISVVRIDFLRNYSLEEQVKVIKRTSKGDIFQLVKKIILVDQISRDKIEIIGFDRLWNMVKVILDLSNDSTNFFQCEKFTFQNIVHFSLCSNRIAILNDWNFLCFQQLKLESVISQEYYIQNGMQTFWKINTDLQKFPYMFLLKDRTRENDIVLMTNIKESIGFLVIDGNFLQINCNLYSLLNNSYRDEIQELQRVDNEKEDLYLIAISQSQIIYLQIQCEVYPSNQTEFKVNEQRKWIINFGYEQLRILYQNNYFQFVSIQGRSLKIFDTNLNQTIIISKNYNIKNVGQMKGNQSVYYVMSSQNEIDFHSFTGEFLVRFNLSSFLVRVDKALYDVAKVIVQVIPISNYAFLLQTDNYLSVFVIHFDKNDQAYKISSIKQTYLNGRDALYCKRFSRLSRPQTYQFYNIANCLIVKTGKKVKVLGNSLIRCLADNYWMPSTMQYKLINQLNNVQIQDSDFLSELIQLGNIQLVQHILKIICLKFQHHGSLGNHFMVPYKYLLDLYHLNQQIEPIWIDAVKTYDSKSLQIEYDYTQNPISILQKISNEYPLKLNIILGFLQYYEENSRALDFYASMFMFHVYVFRNQPRKNKQSNSLSSKDVAWALHSLQKETLWQECIGSSDDMSWNLIKRYSATLWMDLSFLKKRLEDIALEIYKQNKDPFQSLLYYIILNKKPIITTLFKKEVNSGKEYKSTYDFLQQDFTQARWKSAASKNAYALVSKKRYQDAAAFFLIGGHLNDAVNVIARYMEDIQLAYLTTKIYEPMGGPVGEQLINDYFIQSGKQMNDIWLQHIGYHLLGRYVDSVNVLLQNPEHHPLEYDNYGKAICVTWPTNYTPLLSYFHPSAVLLAEKLKESIWVKREIQESIDARNKIGKKPKDDDIFSQFYESEESEEEESTQINQELPPIKEINNNFDFVKQQAVEYYYNIQMPQLGLIFASELNSQTKFTEQLIELQIEMYIVQAIEDSEHFTNYVQLMQKLDDLANFAGKPKDDLYKIALSKFKLLKSPSRLLTFAVHYDQSGLDEFIAFCQETQCLLYRLVMDYPMQLKTQEYYLTYVQSLYEIDVGLKLFQQSQYYQKKFDNKIKLNILKLLALFMTLIMALELKLWENAFEQLRKLETFCNTVYKQHVQDCGYENLRDDILELVKQVIKGRRLYRNKGLKGYRSVDILQDAFPEDLYEVSEIEHKQRMEISLNNSGTDGLENSRESIHYEQQPTQPIQIQMLQFALRTLIVDYFLSISKNYFKVEQFNLNTITYSNIFHMAEQYVNTRSQVIDQLFTNLQDFSLEQSIIEDLRLILKENSLTKSQFFKNLDKVFQLQHLFQTAQKIKLDYFCEDLQIKRSKQAFKYPISVFDEQSIITHKNKLFKIGVEIFKTKNEIKGLCINNANPNEAYIWSGKQLKYLNIDKNLNQKNRSSDGYQLLEEDNDDQQNPMIAQASPKKTNNNNNKPYIIKLCSSVIQSNEQNILQKRGCLYEEYKNFTDKDFSEKFQNCSNQRIAEDDFNCVTSHPHLPLFLLGGKGTVNILTMTQKCSVVSEFSTQYRESLDNLKFNCSGELFLGHDTSNNAFIWKLNKVNKINTPLFILNNKTRPTTDLTFVNEGTVFASIYNSTSKPHFGLYDMLLPGSKNLVAQENFNGTDILFSTPLNSILIGNQKKGTVNFLDIRKNQVYKTLELPFTEVKFFKLNQYQTSLICACNDGQIKIVNCENLQTIADLKPFKNDKKQQITALTQSENATYAACSDGTISLVYLNA